MTPGEAVLLGLVQGVFMFVPVSSTSHLVLVQHLLIDRGSAMAAPESPEMVLFDLVVHVGTLGSIVLVMGTSLFAFLRSAYFDVLGRPIRRFAAFPAAAGVPRRLLGLGLLATAVTGVLGLALRPVLADVFARPGVVAAALIATGAMLWWTDRAGLGHRGLRDLTATMAIVVGVAQAAALMPGLSRSGLTIFAALLVGLRRRWAAEFSFFVAIPTIGAGALVQAIDVVRDPAITVDPVALTIGALVAAVSGAVALWFVLRLLYRSRFRFFAVYVWVLAAVVLVVPLPAFAG